MDAGIFWHCYTISAAHLLKDWAWNWQHRCSRSGPRLAVLRLLAPILGLR